MPVKLIPGTPVRLTVPVRRTAYAVGPPVGRRDTNPRSPVIVAVGAAPIVIVAPVAPMRTSLRSARSVAVIATDAAVSDA